ncbi:LD-carboxypeptidase [Neobacillus notoginsengisoli]|uniref:LD-carboxypeptidase n=1 Tax=Neobacillus notoginsengisoli TaxID=1578198 RepID=A0A417YXS3_9BACI|nr:S66 peptidase family protein [Neobacillus notoginsengisoli]RHW42258.1 LD-carboxypeptidase [Neobacillus notoginsengisoli]
MLPNGLSPGDEIRVIAPSRSMDLIKSDQVKLAISRLEGLGFNVTFGKNVHGHDEFFSSSIGNRIDDLHEAFSDSNVKGMLTVIGGYNSNQLLKYIDWDLIRRNPKVFCGYSDITALSLAIYRKTGLITYSGPHFSTFGIKHGLDYTLSSFLEAVTNDAPYEIEPSGVWSDDAWYLDQEDRNFIRQNGFTVIQEGQAEGTLIGGNLCTMNLLHGTEFMPSLKNSILFIEDDLESHSLTFERNLQSLLHQPGADGIKGVLIGRFQKDSQVTEDALKSIIHSKAELKGIPVIANVNFGHTQPLATIPVGAYASMKAVDGEVKIEIDQTRLHKNPLSQ